MNARTIVVNILTYTMLLCLLSGAYAGDLLTLTWVTDNTPGGEYIVGGGTDFRQDKPGIEIELYNMVAQKLGFQLQYKRMPWKQCLQQIESNNVDGVFPASFKPERKAIGVFPMFGETVDPSRKTRNNAYYLYKLKSSNLSWDGKEFKGADGLIAVPSGWAIVEDIRKRGVEIKEVSIHQNSPELLLLRRVEGFICLETVFDSYLKRQSEKYADIVKEAKPFWEKPYYLMLSHKFVDEHPKLAHDIWETIYEIRHSEVFDGIVEKYIQ